MADNPLVQVSRSIVGTERFVARSANIGGRRSSEMVLVTARKIIALAMTSPECLPANLRLLAPMPLKPL
jgi:hypothetical protein